MKHRRFSLLIFFALLSGQVSQAQQRMVLFGGRAMPAEATQLATKWGQRVNPKTKALEKGKILIIGFPSQVPQDYFNFIGGEFKKHAGYHDQDIMTIERIDNQNDRSHFVEMFKEASIVYFTGGDQTRGMEMLRSFGLLSFVRKEIKGKVYVGKSAGTAMSGAREAMITGTSTDPAEGLGLIDAIVDTHFLARPIRQSRIQYFMQKMGKRFGIGVDEDGALAFDGNIATVVGPKPMMFYERYKNGIIRAFRANSNQQVDLNNFSLRGQISTLECGTVFSD